MQYSRFTRLISMIIAIAMIIQPMPVHCLTVSAEADTAEVAAEEARAISVVGEVESLREESTKHFRLSDGSFIAVSYGMPVHYEDENGIWQDIDNTLMTNSSSNTYQLNRTDADVSFSNALTDGTVLTTSIGDVSVSMSLLDTAQAIQMISGETDAELNEVDEEQSAEAGAVSDSVADETASVETAIETVPDELNTETITQETIAENELASTVPEIPAADSVSEQTEEPAVIGEASNSDEVSLTPAEMLSFDRTASAQITEEAPAMLMLQENYDWCIEDIIPDTLQSSLIYEDVFPDVDILYTAYGHNIKEEIIVHSQQDAYRYDFLLDLDGLTAELNEDGSVSLLDDQNEQVYSIPAPYMEDGNHVFSSDVHYILTNTTQGTILTVEADKNWINSEERVFPVKIDPSLVLKSYGATDDLYSTYLMEDSPDANTLGRQNLYVGSWVFSASKGRFRLFIHFNNLPDVPEGCEVVDAQFSLSEFEYVNRGCDSFPIGIYEVISDKPSQYANYFAWFDAMTWNTDYPEYDESNALDYEIASMSYGYRTWDITELVKKWYIEDTENTTVALIMMTEDRIDWNNYCAAATFTAYGYYTPTFIVSYRNNTGIEPYYTYATLGAGTAGTAYIADATGQLKVGKELVSYASTTNPFSLNLVYNSDYFQRTSDVDYQPPSQLGLSTNIGSGWTLDCIQKVVVETINNVNYLKYYDGDGTIHYFHPVSAPDDPDYPYYDEDGLGLKMRIDSTNNYTMADDHGNTWVFTSNYLTSITDSDGNQLTTTYTDGKITEIKQTNNGKSAITVATFGYNEDYLQTVTDASGVVYTLNYTDSKLTSINRGSTTIAAYTYDGYQLDKMTDSESNYSLSYTYVNGKVSSYRELGGSTAGAIVAITYPSHSQTTYRNYGQNKASTADDILTHYLFDHAGRTVNAYTTDNAGNILGATNAVYSNNSETSRENNRTQRTSSIGVAGQQLLTNTSVESTSNAWDFTNTNRSPTNPRTGSYSIQGTQSSSGVQSAQKTSQSLSVGTYTFSAYVNTSEISSFGSGGIILKVTDSSNTTWTSNPLTYKTAASDDENGEQWARISLTFELETAGTVTVAICNNGAVGTFYADDFQLEKGEAPSNYNLVENGNMEVSNYGWTMGSGAAFAAGTGAASSDKSLLITAHPEDQTTNAYQDIPLNLSGKETFVLSGWVNANAVPDDNDDTDTAGTSKECGLRAIITYADSNSTTETHYVPFNSELSETWQFTSTAIVPEHPEWTIASIRIVCAYEGNANVAYFDNISLVQEVAQTMRYDDDGNLEAVTTTGLTEDANTYENGNLIQVVTGGKGTYDYTYDTTFEHRLTSVTNGLITQSMGYDSVGNVAATTLSGSGGKTIGTSATYDSTGNRLASVTDATGASVTYAYGNAVAEMTGLPTSVTAPNGTVTLSTYDENYRVTETGIANTANLQYTYSSGNLSSVQRTDSSNDTQTYSFTYDSFGNMLSASVGSRTLAEYTYNSGNGLLASQEYGNGDVVEFTYDNLGRTKTVTYDNGTKLTYTYNGEGSLHSVAETGGNTNVVYLYTYDSIGRLISSQKLENGSCILRMHQTYDENNQLTGQSWQMGSTSYSNTYTYNTDDGSLNTMTTGVGDTLTMHYDGLRRLSAVTGSPFTRGYTYRDISGTQTTTQVAAVAYSDLNQIYEYTYDVQGNIATYTAPGKATVTYTYDAQGQLLRAAGSTTYTYTYDNVGNILTASDGTTTHTYTYGNAAWHDLLTAYDGNAITYDAIGNPLSDGTWTYTWQNGRQLATMSDGTTAISFAYDADGLRTSKTVNGVKHSYLYASGKLLRETYGSNTLDFFYDANGMPYALKYNGTVYYYITNLQGDVMQLVNANGNIVASYDYDPYGKVISATGTMAEINPLRYRGYVYDTESGLYYLQSRYYDPEIGRFLNHDVVFDTDTGFQGFNLFVYCGNNPVCRTDISGMDSSKDEDLDLVEDTMKLYGAGGFSNFSAPVPAPSKANFWLELFDILSQCFKDGLGGMNGVFRSSFSSAGLFLPEEYYINNEAPKLYTPNSEYTNWKYDSYSGEYEYSTAYYDLGGRQVLRIDWTNHGRADHTNPHVHFYLYDGTYPNGIDIRKLK